MRIFLFMCIDFRRKSHEKAYVFVRKTAVFLTVNVSFSVGKRYVYYAKVCLFLLFVNILYLPSAFSSFAFSISSENPYMNEISFCIVNMKDC